MDTLMDDIAGIWPSSCLPHHDLVLVEAVGLIRGLPPEQQQA